jgi:hypothetical protein
MYAELIIFYKQQKSKATINWEVNKHASSVISKQPLIIKPTSSASTDREWGEEVRKGKVCGQDTFVMGVSLQTIGLHHLF